MNRLFLHFAKRTDCFSSDCNTIQLHLLQSEHINKEKFYYYHLQMKLLEGNIFTPVCQSFCSQGMYTILDTHPWTNLPGHTPPLGLMAYSHCWTWIRTRTWIPVLCRNFTLVRIQTLIPCSLFTKILMPLANPGE